MRMYLTGLLFILIIAIFACQSTNEGKIGEGEKLFKTYCVNCHGIDGSLMTNGAKDLRFSVLNLDERTLVISQGRNAMTSFKNTLTSGQIQAVAKFTIQLKDSTIHAR